MSLLNMFLRLNDLGAEDHGSCLVGLSESQRGFPGRHFDIGGAAGERRSRRG